MAVLDRENYFNTVQSIIGTSNTDESLHAMEDLIDTYNHLTESNDNNEWKRKYEELDASWKEKYRHRFFSGGNVPMASQSPHVPTGNDEPDLTIDDLFKPV